MLLLLELNGEIDGIVVTVDDERFDGSTLANGGVTGITTVGGI